MTTDLSSPDREPTVAAPVSRQLAVADLDSSIVFYRDILGFDIHVDAEGDGISDAAEAVRGAARIELVMGDGAPDSTGTHRPRGSAIVFIPTDDVAALRESIKSRGGMPSEIEKVNWIKMRMFDIQDPDGHRLWFGQSFQQPDPPAPPPLLKKAMPQLPLDNVATGVAHFRDVLGFKINHVQDDLGVMDRDQVTVLLIPRTELHKGIGSCYIYVEDADKLYAELHAKGARIAGEPVSHPWGLRDFRVLDLEGNQIYFGQPFE